MHFPVVHFTDESIVVKMLHIFLVCLCLLYLLDFSEHYFEQGDGANKKYHLAKPLTALPDRLESILPITMLQRWNLCQKLTNHFWNRWLKGALNNCEPDVKVAGTNKKPAGQ